MQWSPQNGIPLSICLVLQDELQNQPSKTQNKPEQPMPLHFQMSELQE